MANEEKKTQAPAKQAKSAVKKADVKKLSFFKRVAKWFRDEERAESHMAYSKAGFEQHRIAVVVMLVYDCHLGL